MSATERLGQALDRWQAHPEPATAERVLLEAEAALESHEAVAPHVWHRYLDETRLTDFLLALGDRARRYRWAETTFGAIRHGHVTLETIVDQRAARHPERILFQVRDGSDAAGMTYGQVRRLLRTMAASWWRAEPAGPRVAIFADNSPLSACCDLACLSYDIPNTPLNVHFDTRTLLQVFNAVQPNIAVTDSDLLYGKLLDVRAAAKKPFRILRLDGDSPLLEGEDMPQVRSYADLGTEAVDALLANRRRLDLDAPVTVMFTSGSTGEAKGVVFSIYNLVTKRFARAAALPEVGEHELLLCYLPLYHTFGRYLEMLGMLFWGGTYAFANNPSAETLLALLPAVRPTGLVSIPMRWVQLRDYCMKRLDEVVGVEAHRRVFETLTGGRLRWGLSAAGHLDPKVFRFYHRMGVELCSGFGMTEATGGITMTPPGEYHDGSVGIALPGMRISLTEEHEMLISGPYVARYLGTGSEPVGEWLPTGDLFRLGEDGHYQIVDRIKDIYKNSRGQTIASRRVEQRYDDVPGIKRVFLVGDGRDYNTLLIVPDRDDPVLRSYDSEELIRRYYHQIVTAANKDLAPYERVVSFAVIDRDFSLERGELTPKGSYRRKVVEDNFGPVIAQLYRRKYVEHRVGPYTVRIPRWFFRDLGELETAIGVGADGLVDRQSGKLLRIAAVPDSDRVRVGDLEYRLEGTDLDLGLFARQPLLWAANASLVAFGPCKDGWDIPLGPVAPQAWLPADRPEVQTDTDGEGLARIPPDRRLLQVHRLSLASCFGSGDRARQATEELGKLLSRSDARTSTLVRRRLETLACHPDHLVRACAYRILLLDRHNHDPSVFRAFVQSGLSFLSEDSIELISRQKPERRRLESLRQRLHNYRRELPWPAQPGTRSALLDVLRLLVRVAQYHPENYTAVREELVAWIMHEADPPLAQAAESLLFELADSYERSLLMDGGQAAKWRGKLVFEDGLGEAEIERLRQILVGTSLLRQAITLTTDGEETFYIDEAPADGIWVSRASSLESSSYRVSVNTVAGKHFDIKVLVPPDTRRERVLQTIYWLIAMRNYPFGPPVVPKLGCWRPELGAVALAYVNDLTAWERIREYASVRVPGADFPAPDAWRKLFIRAMAAFFAGWRASDGRIVPGTLSPRNVAVPEPDFREGPVILSLTNWRPYDGTRSLIEPLVRNFYQQTISHFPWVRSRLRYRWIFDACLEGLGRQAGRLFLEQVSREFGAEKVPGQSSTWADELACFLQQSGRTCHVPLALQCAIDRYLKWDRLNPGATPKAREQLASEMLQLYALQRFGEWARYYLYRHTYFREADAATLAIFERILDELAIHPERRASTMVEVSELQASLADPQDRAALSRLVFPGTQPSQQLELFAVGDGRDRSVMVRSTITDENQSWYVVREPIEAAEVGKLYRLYVTAGYHKTISTGDRFLVVLDDREQVVAGLCYQVIEPEVVHLDGIVVSQALRGSGLNSALLEDFCARMAVQGQRAVVTNFFVRRFYMSRGFRVDRRFGGLVRFLPAAS